MKRFLNNMWYSFKKQWWAYLIESIIVTLIVDNYVNKDPLAEVKTSSSIAAIITLIIIDTIFDGLLKQHRQNKERGTQNDKETRTSKQKPSNSKSNR